MSKKTFMIYCENPSYAYQEIDAETEGEAIEYAKEHESNWSFSGEGEFTIHDSEIHA